ncbi:MAG: single-stranded DNA-binding protein [Crocinitomicaceae bacterium]|nr:single-stranded DNA-binding protein [Crocinitomicaceae bacterium]|tara:strand:+ start:40102 stop:40551 length:450 start_codon:yes stop_codon:yes gene_type:complete
MAGSVNKVILIGNVGKDPEVRYLENGSVVANFPIATSEVYKDKNTGKKIENTDWHDVVMWRGLAELAEKYVKKGHKIYIEGKLKKRSWQDKENNTRYTTEVIADVMTMLSRPTENSNKNSNPPYSNEGTPNKPSNMDKEIDKENSDLPF